MLRLANGARHEEQMMPDTKVQFRPGALAESLAARQPPGTSLGSIAARDLDRYYTLLARALAQITLTEPEAMLIVSALNGTYINEFTAALLDVEIEDAIQYAADQQEQIDTRSLITTIRGWNLLQRMAVCDAVERFARYDIESQHARLVRVGLVQPRV